jgi:hypothetical protein
MALCFVHQNAHQGLVLRVRKFDRYDLNPMPSSTWVRLVPAQNGLERIVLNASAE